MKRNKELIAINVQEIYATNDVHQNNSQVFSSGIQRTNSYSSNNNNNSNKNQIHQGFIAVLKVCPKTHSSLTLKGTNFFSLSRTVLVSLKQ